MPALKQRLDWGYYTAPQASALGRRIPQPRGRVLGGSGSINGMVFVRGNRQNYDDWAAAGCVGWSYKDVLPSFKRFEDWEDGATALRGAGGPVKVTRQKDLTPASQAFIEALAATAGAKQIDDYNGEARPWHRRPPRRRRLDHARHPRRQHERPRHDDRRARRPPHDR
jgi:choline dehydrogenase-like flavoprotein